MVREIKEKILKGVPVSPGISIGDPFYYVHEMLNVVKKTIDESEIENEIEKYRDALLYTKNRIKNDRKEALKKAGADAAKIFDSHKLIVEDEVIINEAISLIRNDRDSASYAVSKIMRNYQTAFENMQNDFFSQRSFDIEDVSRRIIRSIKFLEKGVVFTNKLEGKRVIISNNIFPSDAINFERNKLLGIVTKLGGKTSHTSILARSFEVPAVVGVKSLLKFAKKANRIIIDGFDGTVVINPTDKTLKYYEIKKSNYEEIKNEYVSTSKLESVTKDGVKVVLSSNIQSENEIENVLKWSSKGVGLFRTEFLFENKIGVLTEEEQYDIYKEVSEKISPNNVIMRLVDIGGDKLLDRSEVKEDNPFLGLRGLRLLFNRPDLLKPQIRAILRASAEYKNLWIMIPFLTELYELRKVKQIINSEIKNLIRKGIPVDENIKIGTMIEIPSAVLVADTLAKFTDFFSLGTNDLIQYTLAADRGSEKVSYLYDSLHPAVLKLIKMTIDSADKRKIHVGLCGLMGGNPLITPLLIGLGLRNISVTPFQIPEIKKIVRNISMKECKELADEIMVCTERKMIQKILEKFNEEKVKIKIKV